MNCLICKRITQIKNNSNPYFVKELETGFVVLEDYQYYKGYTFFLSKNHTDELHKLGSLRIKYLKEMALVAEAVYRLFKPNKLNYELLGNTDRHLHWHIIPRHKNDPNPTEPIWVIGKKIRCSNNTKPSLQELKKLTKQLKKEIEGLIS